MSVFKTSHDIKILTLWFALQVQPAISSLFHIWSSGIWHHLAIGVTWGITSLKI